MASPPDALENQHEKASPSKAAPAADHNPPLNQKQSFDEAQPKQRRNKPTLNCGVCVERKTRCDRARPSCLPCIRRQTTCRYSRMSDILVATQPLKLQNLGRPGPSSFGSQFSISTPAKSASPQEFRAPRPAQKDSQPQSSKNHPQSAIPTERSGPFKIFGKQSKHPFHNYWTSSGGLPEVIGVLPNKEQADLLVDKFFATMDPLYPIIWRPDFQIEYERFWSLPEEQRYEYDAAELALHFVVYAVGTQFTETLNPEERVNSAEFYLSASHQSLCIFSYLNRFSLPTVRTMVLICHFLVSNNHVSDAWNFSGITHRQAYGLKLNRNPDEVTPDLVFQEKQQRCRLWLATMFQDTSLSLYLELPPSTVYHDVEPTCLKYADELQGYESVGLADSSYSNDIAYLRSLWEYSSFLQTNLCIPKSLKQPLSKDPMQKTQLISRYWNMYSSWRPPFNSRDPGRFEIQDHRLRSQLISVSSNYFYVLTMLYMDKNDSAGVACDIYGALDAAHEAMSAFFALVRHCPAQVDIWGAYHTRGFSQAMNIGTILAEQSTSTNSAGRDARLMLAKSDFDRYLDILMRARGTADYEAIQAQRIFELQALRDRITVA